MYKKLKSTIKTELKKITDPKIYVVVNVHFELSNLGNCKFPKQLCLAAKDFCSGNFWTLAIQFVNFLITERSLSPIHNLSVLKLGSYANIHVWDCKKVLPPRDLTPRFWLIKTPPHIHIIFFSDIKVLGGSKHASFLWICIVKLPKLGNL